tara:strand:+ start:980 stop:1375 length:396 start_codon:yes stop_codon:yes gene_type:complete
MSGLSPKLPLHPDSLDGYALNKNYRELIQQNLKCLLLTNPGERIMEPEFGVGVLRYMFEINDPVTYGRIVSKIEEQVEIYMPFVRIVNLDASPSLGPDLDPSNSNAMRIKLQYEIMPLGISDIIEIIDKLA